MVHQRAAHTILTMSVVGLTIAFFPAAAHADDGECNRGRDGRDCAATCTVDTLDGRADDEEAGDDRDEIRRHRDDGSRRGRGDGSTDLRDEELDIDDDCLPPAVVPEVATVVLLPATAAGVFGVIAFAARRRRLRAA